MKSITYLLIPFSLLLSCRSADQNTGDGNSLGASSFVDSLEKTNNFYDNTETFLLPVSDVTVEGEVAKPVTIRISDLPLRSVIVKETLFDPAGGNHFVGAYRYDGYSLFDLLSNIEISKSNAAEFNPVIDLYIEVENTLGEKAVFSWGEIFYPNNLHKIIIASGVSRIVPSKSKDLWPVASESRIIAANDLITERNISSPVKITVKSFPRSFETVKGLSPIYSDNFNLYDADKKIASLSDIPWENEIEFNTVFYGRGRGIHSTTPFRGKMLKDIISSWYPADKQSIKTGMLCIAAKDGYRIAVSFSELFNRNDQQEFLLVRGGKNEDGGLYRVFPACDFFSDRAVKAVTDIYLIR